MQPAGLGAATWCFVSGTLLVGMLVLAPPGRAQTDLQTPQQANERIRALSDTISAPPHDYVIGRGDLLGIEVFDVPELSRDIRVSQTGTIGFPLVPVRLHIAGLTEMQAAQKIAEILEANGLVSHPQVIVTVKEKKSNPITVVGAVAHPMVYESDGSTTLLQVLAQAGGIAPDAGDTVIITRPDISSQDSPGTPPQIGPEDVVPLGNTSANQTPLPSPRSTPAAAAAPPVGPSESAAAAEPPPLGNTLTVNLSQLIESGDPTNNILLQGGDIVTVPHAGIVYVLGAVARPGGFVATNDRTQLTTLKVLALAGGLNRTAKKDQAVIIRKDSLGQQHEVPVDLGKIIDRKEEDVSLLPSDVLYIPNSGAKTALIRAAEIGLAVGTAVAIYRIGTR
ncbi:MAG TPA: polysaccharide biosynthesis/export family protein [Candidatus Acidoferrum sp.]|nr:polysaccharide biosynthesis/export family protein [Candidatus Acidoferrum sp.]